MEKMEKIQNRSDNNCQNQDCEGILQMQMKEKHKPCREQTESHLYRIGMFAQMNHITVKALRFYEEQGLLCPAYVEEENGYRYYTLDQMAAIHQITALKQAGFTLDDIKHIRWGVEEEQLLRKKKSQLLAKIAELTRQIAVIDAYLLDESSSLSNPVLIKTLPACKVAASEKTIDSYDDLFDVMPEMGAEMEQLGCECALPEYCFTQYLEPGFKEENIRIETCEAVTKLLENTETLKFYELEETTAACIFHKGSYADFSRTYAVLLKYIEENGYEITGNIRESYIDGIWNKDDESEWLSEIQIPVRKRD